MSTPTSQAAVPDMAVWRSEVRSWLASILPARADVDDETAHTFAVFHNLTVEQERDFINTIRAYRKARFDAGYGALTLAVEHGGAGLPASFATAMTGEEAGFAVPPSHETISVTTGLVSPALAMFGSEELREQFLRSFLRTDLLCCQLFSEPGAGSDLAALGCRAVRDGDDWVVNGQKVWSSGAQFAEYGFLLARTDPDAPKHRGITAFLMPMDASGVEIRSIRQMNGGSSFNEVFLSDVRISDRLRVGAEGEGWRVATATLAFERTASGSSTRRKGGSFDDLLKLAQHLRRSADPVTRQQLADLYIRGSLRAATAERVARAAAAGISPGPAASVGKLLASDVLVRTGELAADLLGTRLSADVGEEGTFEWTEHLLGAPGYRLAGGTDQIQRNIIAERVLGLPPEPRVDKDVPWSALVRS
jgi:alkylation response protein AidB-like acyl-CoA dehydrogenase